MLSESLLLLTTVVLTRLVSQGCLGGHVMTSTATSAAKSRLYQVRRVHVHGNGRDVRRIFISEECSTTSSSFSLLVEQNLLNNGLLLLLVIAKTCFRLSFRLPRLVLEIPLSLPSVFVNSPEYIY